MGQSESKMVRGNISNDKHFRLKVLDGLTRMINRQVHFVDDRWIGEIVNPDPRYKVRLTASPNESLSI